MFETKSDLFARREDKLIKIIENVFKRFWGGFIHINYLGNTGCIKRLVFYVCKKAEELFELLLHRFKV